MPYKTLLDPSTGGYLPRDQMLQVLAQSGVEFGADKPFLCYCNGGVASTAVLFALWQLGAPLENLSNYDGSWSVSCPAQRQLCRMFHPLRACVRSVRFLLMQVLTCAICGFRGEWGRGDYPMETDMAE